MNIDVEVIKSWPIDLLAGIEENLELILSYHKEEKRIFNTTYRNAALRTFPPSNQHKGDYDGLIELLERRIETHNLVGYHCTRLTPYEAEDIRKSGMKILSKELVEKRISTAHSQGLLSIENLTDLRENTKDTLNNEHGNRTGMLWFCPNISSLKMASGVFRLFRYWGGEAVYLGHEDGPDYMPVLHTIGEPYIVKCAVPIPETEHFYQNMADRFISFYIRSKIKYPHPSFKFDFNVKRDLEAREVVELIPYSCKLFAKLTGCIKWDANYSIAAT